VRALQRTCRKYRHIKPGHGFPESSERCLLGLVGALLRIARPAPPVTSDARDYWVSLFTVANRATVLSKPRNTPDEWCAYIVGTCLRGHSDVCLADPQRNGQVAIFHNGHWSGMRNSRSHHPMNLSRSRCAASKAIAGAIAISRKLGLQL
jgi:hypothetical protein